MASPDFWKDTGWPAIHLMVASTVRARGVEASLTEIGGFMMTVENLALVEYWHEVYTALLEMKIEHGSSGNGTAVRGHMGSGGGSNGSAAGADGAG